MSDECLRQFTPALHATESIHLFVQLMKSLFRLLAGMSETCGPLAALRSPDIYIISGMKLLCLRALIDFEVVRAKFLSPPTQAS